MLFTQRLFCLVVLGLTLSVCSRTEQTTIAVAANFAPLMEQLITRYNVKHSYPVTMVTGSTGKLYAQILNGAPYDMFFAADQTTPAELARLELGATPYTYATGHLALCATSVELSPDNTIAILTATDYAKLAIANPKTAPYGTATIQLLQDLEVFNTVQNKLVKGENVAQALHFVASGNVELGIVAQSLALVAKHQTQLSCAAIEHPAAPTIPQDAIVLEGGMGNSAATTFTDFLKSSEAQTMIQDAGYSIDAD